MWHRRARGPELGVLAAELAHIAERMADTIAHRGPDDAATWSDPEHPVALHRRLSVIDLSPDGRQPMCSGSGRYVISYNGEIYNFRDLRAELADLGHRFHGTSDTAVLVEALDEWGVQATLERLNGMFAFAAWDRASRRLSLARPLRGEAAVLREQRWPLSPSPQSCGPSASHLARPWTSTVRR